MYTVTNTKTGKRLGGLYMSERLAQNAVLSEVLMYIQLGKPSPYTVFDYQLTKTEIYD